MRRLTRQPKLDDWPGKTQKEAQEGPAKRQKTELAERIVLGESRQSRRERERERKKEREKSNASQMLN